MADNDLFQPYPVTGDKIRAVARQGQRHVASLRDLAGRVSTSDQVRSLETAVMYATGALNLFADAVDRYNETSDVPAPRSIAKLNAAHRDTMRAEYSWPDDFDPQRFDSDLFYERSDLEANLDEEAERVSQLLGRGPNADDIRLMFAAGALPVDADLTFGHLGPLLPSARAEEWGRELARRLLDTEEDPSTPLLASIARYQHNPHFAAGFAGQLPSRSLVFLPRQR